MNRSLRTLLLAGAAALTLAAACSQGPARSRDVAGDRRPRSDAGAAGAGPGGAVVPEPPRPVEPTAVKGDRPRVVVKASARALAIDAGRLYYGDSDDDGVYSVPAAGGEPLRIARHAPVAGAIALTGGSITWIASPGDAVLRAPVGGGVQPTTVRDRGIFSDVAAFGDDVFITEAIGAGGALLRVNGATSARLAAFDAPPRAVLADATHVYVATPTKVVRTPHARGELEPVGTGARFTHTEIDEGFVYVVADIDKGRGVVRFPKAGGAAAVVARDVRDAPIEIEGGELLYFDATRAQLRSVPVAGGASRAIIEDETLATVSAIEADATTIYVAVGVHETGAIVAIRRR
jgi:hypothetical protein